VVLVCTSPFITVPELLFMQSRFESVMSGKLVQPRLTSRATQMPLTTWHELVDADAVQLWSWWTSPCKSMPPVRRCRRYPLSQQVRRNAPNPVSARLIAHPHLPHLQAS
jgi:hypothetical protein